jgi:hypothetical protein
MVKKKDMIGNIYGLWTVIGETEKKRASYFWLCRCQCGTEKLVEGCTLRNGTSKSCGCHLLDKKNRIEKIKNNYEINENGCWIWKGFINQDGYGRIGDLLAHRCSYEIYKGNIPKDMCICHNCPNGDNRACINPDHLWIGTHFENVKDKFPKGRQLSGEKIGSSKLKQEQVVEIKKRLKNGEKPIRFHKEYNVSVGIIYHIKNGRAWKHVE